MLLLSKLFEMKFSFRSNLPTTPGQPIHIPFSNLKKINNNNKRRLINLSQPKINTQQSSAMIV